MGSLQSSLSSEGVVAGTAVAAVVAVALYNAKLPTTGSSGDPAGPSAKKPRKRKGKGVKEGDDDGTPPSLAAPAALFDDTLKDSVAGIGSDGGSTNKMSNSLQVPKASKKKRKSAKSAGTTARSDDELSEKTPEPQRAPATSSTSSLRASGGAGKKTKLADSTASLTSSPSIDASWMRVDSRAKGRGKREGTGSDPGTSAAEASSDAGATTSATGDEAETGDDRQTLAERLVQKPPKTEVDDMLPADPGLARVMRIGGHPIQETPGGISWRDYEDADEMQQSTDADAEDDEGWGIVQGRKRTPRPAETTPPSSASNSRILPSTISEADAAKRQRQREAKREARKEAKADGEAQRLATLARYKREQENERMEAQAKKGGGKVLSGGMNASVQNGALVWE